MTSAQHAHISSLNCTILLVGWPKEKRETDRITIFACSLCSCFSLSLSVYNATDNQLLQIVLNNSYIN